MIPAFYPEAFPSELTESPNWVVFDQVSQPNGKKPKKVPYTPGTNRQARVNDSSTCRPFAEAMADAKRTGRLPGVRLTPEMGITLIDVDGGVDEELIEVFGSYTERSINGGMHILVRGRPPATFIAPPGIEVYPRDGNRLLLLTGDIIDGRDTIHDRTALLTEHFPPRPIPPQHAGSASLNLDDPEALTRCRRMTGFSALYDHGDLSAYGDDHSCGDLGLLNYAVVAGVTDPDQLDRILRTSALYREKWERDDYRERTIAKALNGTVTPFEAWDQRATSTPQHVAMDARPTLPAGDPCAPVRDELAELQAENARLRAELAQTKRDLSAVIKVIGNPNLGGDAAGKALVLAATYVQAQRDRMPSDDDYYRVTASRVADNREWFDQLDEQGQPVLDEHGNPVRVSVPVPAQVSPRTITKYLAITAERGLIPAEKREVSFPKGTNEVWHWKAASTLADQLAPLTGGSVYDEDNPRPIRGGDPKQRRLTPIPGCPDCGRHHVACASCGTLFDAPAALDLDTRATMTEAEIEDEGESDERQHILPANSRSKAPVVITYGVTSLQSTPSGSRWHSRPPSKAQLLERAGEDLDRRAFQALPPEVQPTVPAMPQSLPGLESPPPDYLTDSTYGARR